MKPEMFNNDKWQTKPPGQANVITNSVKEVRGWSEKQYHNYLMIYHPDQFISMRIQESNHPLQAVLSLKMVLPTVVSTGNLGGIRININFTLTSESEGYYPIVKLEPVFNHPCADRRQIRNDTNG